MRRDLRALTAAAPLLFLAAPAGATRIEFLWEATGTNHITVMPGAEIVLQAWVTVEEPGIALAAVSALATPGLLEALSFEGCPLHASNPFGPGSCGTDPALLLDPIGDANVVLNQQYDATGPIPGLSGSFAAARPGVAGPTGGSFVLANVTYQVTGVGSGQVLPYYRTGIDGIVENGFDVVIPPADGADVTSGVSFTIVPEPSAIGVLAGGLLALAAWRRRAALPASARPRR